MDNKNLKNNAQTPQPKAVKDAANNMFIYEQVRTVPDTAIRPIQSGRLKGKSDINPMWRIQMLTELFGPCGFGWRIEITKQWLESAQNSNEVSAFVNISLYIKYKGEWSSAIVGTGGSSFIKNELKGAYQSDECYKMALTDAISVACKFLGIGADIYWQEGRTKYTTQQPILVAAPARKIDDQLNAALQEVNSAKSIDSLNTIYAHYPMYQSNGLFLNSLREKSAQFKTN
jgi:hypothetical protein